MAYKAKITKVSDLTSGRVEIEVLYFSVIEEEKPFTKFFSFSADAGISTKAQAMQIVRDFKKQLNDLVNVMTALKADIDKEV